MPKEVCVLVRTNPRKVKRPLVKKWCGPDPNVSYMQDAPRRYQVAGRCLQLVPRSYSTRILKFGREVLVKTIGTLTKYVYGRRYTDTHSCIILFVPPEYAAQ